MFRMDAQNCQAAFFGPFSQLPPQFQYLSLSVNQVQFGDCNGLNVFSTPPSNLQSMSSDIQRVCQPVSDMSSIQQGESQELCLSPNSNQSDTSSDYDDDDGLPWFVRKIPAKNWQLERMESSDLRVGGGKAKSKTHLQCARFQPVCPLRISPISPNSTSSEFGKKNILSDQKEIQIMDRKRDIFKTKEIQCMSSSLERMLLPKILNMIVDVNNKCPRPGREIHQKTIHVIPELRNNVKRIASSVLAPQSFPAYSELFSNLSSVVHQLKMGPKNPEMSSLVSLDTSKKLKWLDEQFDRFAKKITVEAFSNDPTPLLQTLSMISSSNELEAKEEHPILETDFDKEIWAWKTHFDETFEKLWMFKKPVQQAVLDDMIERIYKMAPDVQKVMRPHFEGTLMAYQSLGFLKSWKRTRKELKGFPTVPADYQKIGKASEISTMGLINVHKEEEEMIMEILVE
ncbi:hypothetical protein B9Z55_007310 [Caenorhabditis nigoni]|nr:hypothetical protein B9Z55_007310 [Caenorhabditis nigoni]